MRSSEPGQGPRAEAAPRTAQGTGRFRRTAFFVFALAALTAATALAPPALPEAHAQRKVRDNRLRDRTSTENSRRAEEIVWKLEQVSEMVRRAERITHLADRLVAVRSVTEAVDWVVQEEGALGYSHADLGPLFDATFSGYDLPPDLSAHAEAQADRLLRTYTQLLAAVGAQMDQFPDAYATLQRFKVQAQVEADNELKASQLLAAVEVYRAEEMMLLRQALALQTNVHALIGAYRADQEAVQRSVIQRALQR